MTNEDIVKTAIQKTICILNEIGVKYGRSDFVIDGYCGESDTTVIYTMNGNVSIYLYFGNNSKSKKLKTKKLELYNYFNCRVDDTRAAFFYTKKELEIEYLKEPDSDNEKMEAVMAKVQKLLALAESDNEHEAISASLMAQKLLAKYNIDMERLDGDTENTQKIEEVEVGVNTGNKWKYHLAECIARNYRCKCYYTGSKIIVFRGYRQDIMIARRVFAYLYSVCKRLGNSYLRRKREESVGSVNGVFNSFCLGFIHGVNSELSKQCTELMLITPKEVEDDFKNFSKSFGIKNTSISLNDMDAFSKGEVEGKRALNAQYIDDNSRYID